MILKIWSDFDGVKNLMLVLEALSYLVTSLGIITIVISLVQIQKEKRKSALDSDYTKKLKSIEILDVFAKEIIPSIDNYSEQLNKELKEGEKYLNKIANSPFKNLIIKNIKSSCGVVSIFNQLESICTYIKYDLADHNIVYEAVNNIVCKFVNDNMDMFEEVKKQGPFSSLQYVVDNWNKKTRKEILKRQKSIIENEIKDLE
ncbi:DUF4760 domain-containing protein [Fastidiosipila sanguinis]|uniref:DUF4760 domain-containing protein n=1 Tax=Fastidiosipila sanguinis TaxID=236753 RepID=A0A2S0KP46_9FIRM|nr:hypothetical protein [Fastidiosipila sanguinis]AVM42811.1 hypothetical protein C5Q98_06120 [Fastidiosipila sanguinis]